jgi:hypothetical protein
MGRCQRASTSKNKKVTENFPPASVLVCGLRYKIALKNYNNITELFKNSVRKK